jgi:hypothetical protein
MAETFFGRFDRDLPRGKRGYITVNTLIPTAAFPLNCRPVQGRGDARLAASGGLYPSPH